MVQSQPRKIVSKTLSQKTFLKNRAGGVAQSQGPEFKPQHCKKKVYNILFHHMTVHSLVGSMLLIMSSYDNDSVNYIVYGGNRINNLVFP
jgi:hypothetical protein